MSRRGLSSSIHEVSPLSRQRDDISAAMEVLNGSMESGFMQDALEERSPQWKSRDDPNAVLIKCKSVIDDLQYELEKERRRSSELESLIETLQEELEAEKEKARSDRSLVERSLRERQSMLSECGELESQVTSLKKKLTDKDEELENMTRYCEKRVGELKKAVKEASCVVATPPIPVDDSLLNQLKNQLVESSTALRAKDEECRAAVESYDKQVKMLRQQLKSSEELIERYITSTSRKDDRPFESITTPSPQLETGKWQSSLEKDIAKLKNARSFNPLAIYN